MSGAGHDAIPDVKPKPLRVGSGVVGGFANARPLDVRVTGPVPRGDRTPTSLASDGVEWFRDLLDDDQGYTYTNFNCQDCDSPSIVVVEPEWPDTREDTECGDYDVFDVSPCKPSLTSDDPKPDTTGSEPVDGGKAFKLVDLSMDDFYDIGGGVYKNIPVTLTSALKAYGFQLPAFTSWRSSKTISAFCVKAEYAGNDIFTILLSTTVAAYDTQVDLSGLPYLYRVRIRYWVGMAVDFVSIKREDGVYYVGDELSEKWGYRALNTFTFGLDSLVVRIRLVSDNPYTSSNGISNVQLHCERDLAVYPPPDPYDAYALVDTNASWDLSSAASSYGVFYCADFGIGAAVETVAGFPFGNVMEREVEIECSIPTDFVGDSVVRNTVCEPTESDLKALAQKAFAHAFAPTGLREHGAAGEDFVELAMEVTFKPDGQDTNVARMTRCVRASDLVPVGEAADMLDGIQQAVTPSAGGASTLGYSFFLAGYWLNSRSLSAAPDPLSASFFGSC